MRSAPIFIGLVISLLCINFSWGEVRKANTPPQKILVVQTPEDREASSPKTQTPKQEKPEKETIALPIYKPPKRGAPGGRVGGATRGDHTAYLSVEVLAPEKVRGLTSQEQPELYWYLSKATNAPIEFTLIDEDTIQPLVETRLPQPAKDGLQRIRLTDFGVHLTPDKMYRWSVALVMDGEHRSKDIMAGARIQQALASEIPAEKLTGVDPLHATFINAEAGLWYDAIAAISQAIESEPEQERYRDIRAALLEQVGLDVVANADRKQMASF